MRLSTLVKLLALGGGATAVLVGNRRMKARRGIEDDVEPDEIPAGIDVVPDPNDPVQGLDEVSPFHVEELGFDARSGDDVSNIHPVDSELGLDEVPTPRETPHYAQGGDLYGVHAPAAMDRTVPDNDQSYDRGENWLEALEATSAENGPIPEAPIDILDDEDLEHPPTDTRDIPVADRGSAGPRGL